VYANFLSDEGLAGVETAYGGRLTRLVALKDRFDPTNFFRLNGNIPPNRRAPSSALSSVGAVREAVGRVP